MATSNSLRREWVLHLRLENERIGSRHKRGVITPCLIVRVDVELDEVSIRIRGVDALTDAMVYRCVNGYSDGFEVVLRGKEVCHGVSNLQGEVMEP